MNFLKSFQVTLNFGEPWRGRVNIGPCPEQQPYGYEYGDISGRPGTPGAVRLAAVCPGTYNVSRLMPPVVTPRSRLRTFVFILRLY